MKNYYITGASGFVGKNLIGELIKKDDIHIYGLFLPNEEKLDYFIQDKITIVRGNVLDEQSVNAFLKNGEGEKIVIHCAGVISVYKNNDPFAFLVNTKGTFNMVDASVLNKVDKFIYISSVDSLSRKKPGEIIVEQDHYEIDEVEGVYSKSKVVANNYVLDACKNRSLPSVIICPSALVGPNDPFAAPINQAIRKFINGKLPAITNGGYDMVDVRDVVDGIVNACEKGKIGESYILSGTLISVQDLMKLASKYSNRKPPKIVVPHFIIKMISPFIVLFAKMRHKRPLFTSFSMDCLRQMPVYSKEKSSKDLGYKSRPLEETIKDTIEWLKEN